MITPRLTKNSLAWPWRPDNSSLTSCRKFRSTTFASPEGQPRCRASPQVSKFGRAFCLYLSATLLGKTQIHAVSQFHQRRSTPRKTHLPSNTLLILVWVLFRRSDTDFIKKGKIFFSQYNFSGKPLGMTTSFPSPAMTV